MGHWKKWVVSAPVICCLRRTLELGFDDETYCLRLLFNNAQMFVAAAPFSFFEWRTYSPAVGALFFFLSRRVYFRVYFLFFSLKKFPLFSMTRRA